MFWGVLSAGPRSIFHELSGRLRSVRHAVARTSAYLGKCY